MRPIILNTKSSIEGCYLVKEHIFECKHKVPLYDIKTLGAFNQIIGFAKFLNAEYGNVYYRGVSGLYDNVRPSPLRGRKKGIPDDLIQVVNRIINDKLLNNSLKLQETIKPKKTRDSCYNKKINRFNKYKIEALLQHYVGSTRFLDVVDNHWIALWMGLQKFTMHGKGHLFCRCDKRQLTIGDEMERLTTTTNQSEDFELYVYIVLLAMPHATEQPQYGIIETDGFVEVDLRQALPSIYLRPHAQHALVIRKRDKNNYNDCADYYDMADQVVGILRIRIDLADKWLGNGMLMTQENIFPSPSIDQGYNTLLMRNDIFKNPFQIIKYF